MTGPKPDRDAGGNRREGDYEDWSRSELIARLQALEQAISEGWGGGPPAGALHPRQSESGTGVRDLHDLQTQFAASRAPAPHFRDAAPVGYLALDREGVIAGINLTGARLLAGDPDALEGEPLSAYLDPADVQPFQTYLETLFETGQAAAIELHFRTLPEAAPRSMVLEGLLTPGHHYGYPVARLVLTDITEIKVAQAHQMRANRALRSLNAVHKAEQETNEPGALLHRICRFLTRSMGFQLAVVMVPDEVDPDQLILAASAGLDQLLSCALHPATWDLPAGAPGPLAAAATCARPLVAQARPADPRDGARPDQPDCIQLGAAAALPLRSEEGLMGVLGLYAAGPEAFEQAEMEWLEEVAAETTVAWRNLELRWARDTLERERAWLTQILDSSPEFVAIADTEGRVLYRNPGALRLLGRSSVELPPGTPMERDYAPWAADTLRTTVLPTVRESGVWRGEMALLCREGREIPIFQVIIGHFDEDGGLVRVSTVGHDLSALKQQRLALERQSRLAALGELASVLAHQLNQPLTAASNFAEGTLNHLEEAADPPDALRSGLEQVQEQVQKAGSVVRNLRNFLKEGKPQVQAVDLNSLIREVAPAVTYQGPETPYRLYLDLDPELPPGQADPIQLREVVLNCLNNAIEAMAEAPPADPEVRITTRATADGLEIQVRDRGPGLPATLREDIDQPLFTTKASGLGLGLAICRSVMEAHGGGFWATDNSNDRGATFHLVLPRATRPEEG